MPEITQILCIYNKSSKKYLNEKSGREKRIRRVRSEILTIALVSMKNAKADIVDKLDIY